MGSTSASGADVSAAARADAGAKPMSMRTVTLVTGDQVQLNTFAGGKEGVTVRPGPGRENVSFTYQSRGDSVTVLPSDALALLQRGVLDERLFDVKALVRMGYDDAKRASLPLIVRYKGGQPGRSARSALERTASVTATLKSVNADVVTTRKAEAAKMWQTMTQSPSLAPGVSRIWLDGTVKAALDKSVRQIGAPEAWQNGMTGKGVATAVLDTGIDAEHPDLSDAILDSRDFTGSPEGAADRNGHGTHVASIITGDGSASDGAYKGVAPDTQLLIGKVLDSKGSGRESQIIAGMEWATSRGARVVNMSLGAQPTDGTDPMAQAVNSLTASTGALFVIAAGNSGGSQEVSTPASADAALAVGAVDAEDHLAHFSSRGPRVGDQAVKPEITAPGVGIAAARAAGTSLGDPVDDFYTRLDGTSMATPHVAGAAALLAQEHPDWHADQLKAALTSTAKPNPDLDVFAQGTGRVDVARAVRQRAYASPGALSAFMKWPHTEPVTRTVTYHNDGDEPLVLDLSVDLDGGSETGKLVTPDRTQVTLPAHGSTELRLVIDSAQVAPGTYSGALTARSSDGSTVIRTALSIYNEPELYDVTFNVTDRAGKSMAPSGIRLLNLETGHGFAPRIANGALTARVPKGRYSVEAFIYTYEDTLQSVTLASRPDAQINADTSVDFDARDGRTVQAGVTGTDTQSTVRWMGVNQTVNGRLDEFRDYTDDPDIEQYAVPTSEVTARPYTFVHLATLSAPAADTAYNLALTHDGRIPSSALFQVDTDDLARVRVRYHAQGDATTGYRSNLAALDGSDRASGGFYDVNLPSERVEYFTPASRVQWLSLLDTGASFEEAPLTHYQAGEETAEEWNKAAVSPLALVTRCDDFLNAPIFAFSPSTPGHIATDFGYTGQATLLRDGVEIGSTDNPRNAAFFGLAPERAQYTLRLNASREAPGVALANRVDAEWTFTSAKPDGDCQMLTQEALLNVRIDGNFSLDNSAPANQLQPLTIDVERSDGTTPEVKELTLEATFDDGATWSRLGVKDTGSRFTAIVPAAQSGNGYVGLRATVSDQDGNKLKQTVIRAYRHR
jgi:subtilisin family serine protease